MYIEFLLPSGAAGMAAGYTAMGIRKQLKQWSEQFGIEYTEHRNRGYRLLVTLPKEENYSAFALTFVGVFWRPWTIIEAPLPKELTYKGN